MDLNSKRAELEQLKKEFFSSSDLYSQYVGGEAEVGSEVGKNIKEQYGYNKDLIGEENKLVAQQTTLPSQYAAELQTGRFAGNPILAGQAAAQQVAAVQQRLGDIRGVRKEREGTIVDIINSVTAAYRGKTERLGTTADIASKKYSTSQGEYDRMYQEDQDRIAREERAKQEAEDKRRYEEGMALKTAELAESRKSTGSSASAKKANRELAQAEAEDLIYRMKSEGYGWGDVADTVDEIYKEKGITAERLDKLFWDLYRPGEWKKYHK